MALRCLVFRGLVKEAEEEINKFLTTHRVNVLHMAQSESGDHVSVTLIVEEPKPLSEEGF
ncbi:MAG: hypothetical protein QF890_02295 [Myxococcota bacterium]|jgi:hypothetical protein|nr:hypothetical protein [bacterium]MCP4741354.1 hypothetical protein [Actinomycetales bacterium]MDP6074618.1 hypothetical protein [Myxococcota bacterium]MDP6244577.1 hypothetical protein [Myxococcota bacterium]MDP7072954.1 hypothetical protein [Myxococcota bacterium]